jgi:hypothetical protein
MIAVTCFSCRRQFNIDETAIAEELEKLRAEKGKHYPVECPHCRKVNKIALSQLIPRRRRRRRR